MLIHLVLIDGYLEYCCNSLFLSLIAELQGEESKLIHGLKSTYLLRLTDSFYDYLT
jgi:hypothetical protein